ncbi:MAG: 4-(cytidine 5'-diphospho)-2-C-methyl-D-erythritol kinase, partial [Acidimicrobiales bacterium]|nr:4-(cytidine 5'-diphospho)-2-C-methyl-D-erythritol kinase [Acidimicrobiales bacterium]
MHVERAPAKLTVSLRITGVRPDGYHLLDAEMVTLDYGDVLTFDDGDGLEVVGPHAAGVPAGEENLVRRALAAVGRRAFVRLDKQVPAGAGLGGGSSDAAAVLRWAGCKDVAVAARLGADVAFCVVGGRARVRGVGEVVEPLPVVPRTFTL